MELLESIFLTMLEITLAVSAVIILLVLFHPLCANAIP